MKTITLVKTYVVGVMLLLFSSCMEVVDTEVSENYSESEKEVAGSWKIRSVSRNDADITDLMDFSKFRMNLSKDGSYTLTDPIPFLIYSDGTWGLDDPKYPFAISFKGASGDDVSTEFAYPIVGGRRLIQIRLKPGCTANSYEYVMEKVED